MEDQSNARLLTGVDLAIEELSESASGLREVGDYLQQTTQTDADLQAVVEHLRSTKQLSAEAANWANFGIESLREKLNLLERPMVFSTEGIKNKQVFDTGVAIEGLSETLSVAQAAVSNSLAVTMIRITDYLDKYKRALAKLRELQTSVETKVAAVNPSGTPVAAYIKPEHWCEMLMYTDSGFIKGLKGVPEAVSDLLKEHADTVIAANTKYRKWVADNGKKMMEGDYKVIDTLGFDPSDFVVGGGKVYTQSVGSKVPTGENVFFQGRELPGGMSLYTEAYRVKETGLHAISAIKAVNYFLDIKNPAAFYRARVELTEQIALTFLVWTCQTVIANAIDKVWSGTDRKVPLFAPIAYVGAKVIGYHWGKATPPGKTIKITDKMLFHTLTPTEIRSSLAGVRKGIDEVENWRGVVLNRNWGDRANGFDKYVELLGFDSVDAYRGRSVEQLKEIVLGLINLTKMGQCGLDVYAFKVYTAMLKYVEQSTRRYVKID